MELTMLILSRKIGEEIILGDDIVIKVTETAKGSVKLGIEAPREMIILRGELREKIRKANQEASRQLDLDALHKLSTKLKK
jgi:carbon storage regulator